MKDSDLHILLEVQYLKGRIDELEIKALPQVLNLHKSRKLDLRIQKYHDKLKATSELAYHLFIVEKTNRQAAKLKSKKNIKELLEDILPSIDKEEHLIKVKQQINKLT
jgi:hypothetical protein